MKFLKTWLSCFSFPWTGIARNYKKENRGPVTAWESWANLWSRTKKGHFTELSSLFSKVFHVLTCTLACSMYQNINRWCDFLKRFPELRPLSWFFFQQWLASGSVSYTTTSILTFLWLQYYLPMSHYINIKTFSRLQCF